MKKILLLLMVASILFSLTACNSGNFVDSLKSSTLDTLKKAAKGDNLVDALLLGNLERVKEAVDNGADVNKVSFRYGPCASPLLYSMRESQLCIPEYLLSKGADPNFIDNDGMSILMYTVGGQKTGLNYDNVKWNNNYLTLLNDKRTNVNLTGTLGYTALDYACRDNGDLTIVNNLIKHGAKITATTMKCAIEGYRNGFCDESVVKLVFDSLKQQKTDFSIDPAIDAAIRGDSKNLISLIKEGEVKQEDKQVVMFLTCAFGDAEALKELVDKNVDINEQFVEKTYLGVSSSYGKIESIEYLLSKGAHFEWDLEDNYSALANALEYNRLDIAEYLLNHGAKLPIRESGTSGGRPDILERACINGNIDTIKWIFAHGYPITEEYLFLAMNAAARYDQIDVLKYLIFDLKANINTLSYIDTVLDNAVRLSSLETVKFLVDNGANIDGVKNEFMTPVQSAAMDNKSDILLYLVEKGANVNLVGSHDGNKSTSALALAIQQGYFDIVKILVEHGADIHYKEGWTSGKDTPLEIAEREKSQHIIDYLKNAQNNK